MKTTLKNTPASILNRRVGRLNELFGPSDSRGRANQDAAYRVDWSKWTNRRKNGWPVESARPFHLSYVHTFASGAWEVTHIASFATLEALETNLRGRAGC